MLRVRTKGFPTSAGVLAAGERRTLRLLAYTLNTPKAYSASSGTTAPVQTHPSEEARNRAERNTKHFHEPKSRAQKEKYANFHSWMR